MRPSGRWLLLHVAPGQQQILLIHITDHPCFPGDVFIIDNDLACFWGQQSGNDIEKGAFPTATGAKNGNKFALIQMNMNVFNNVLMVIFLGYPGNLEHAFTVAGIHW